MKKNVNLEQIANDLIKLVGGTKNIRSFTNCQTRLRINVSDLSKVSKDKIEFLPQTLGLHISGTQVQVIYGPGKVIKMKNAFENILGKTSEDFFNDSLENIVSKNKAFQKSKNTSSFQRFIGKFSGIFAPLILGFIGAGILSGIGGILQSSYTENGKWINEAAHSWYGLFSVLMNIWKGTFLVIVGWRTAEAFNGSGVIGAIIGGLYVAAFASQFTTIFIPNKSGFNFLGIHINGDNWFVKGFRPFSPSEADKMWSLSYPSGSIFGVMFSAGLVGTIEKYLRKIVPSLLDTIVTPTITLLILLILNFTLIFPISGYVFVGISFLFSNLYANPFGASLLAGIFLITVVFGIHQGFVPVYAALLKTEGVNGLFPVLAMAGAGQVGMAIALYLRANKNGKLKKQIQGAIIPAILGIGEPLIYGVSLPRFKPFITASIGGAIGGFFIGAINLWVGDPVGLNTMFGPSGILMLPLMTTKAGIVWKGILIGIGGIAISYVSGFLTTYYFGHKNIDLA